MSLLPLLLSAWWAEIDRPMRMMDQQIGMGLSPEQLILSNPIDPLNILIRNRAALELARPLNGLLRPNEAGSMISMDKGMFKAILDVQQFNPEEINVRLSGQSVIIEAKHEEKRDQHGLISRQFIRKYLLPENVDANQLSSNISSDGILTIMAPLKQEQSGSGKNIPIQLTGQPAIRGNMMGSWVPWQQQSNIQGNQQPNLQQGQQGQQGLQGQQGQQGQQGSQSEN